MRIIENDASRYLTPLQIAQELDRGYLTARFLHRLSSSACEWLAGNARQVYCAPPRHGKSLLLCRYAPAWYLLFRPSAHIIFAANAARTAQRHMYAVAEILVALASRGLPAPTPLASNQHQVILRGGGQLHAIGIRSTALGLGGDLIIFDDPYRHILDAYSARVREQVELWFYGTLQSRLHPSGNLVVVQQRMHPSDIAGQLIAAGWQSYVYPAIDHEGRALFPARYPIDRLEAIREDIGERFFMALYQQSPMPDSGSLFIPAHFEHRYQEPPELLYRVLAVDTAVKAEEYADFTALALWGYDGANAYLLDIHRAHLTYPDMKRLILRYAERSDAVVVEDANVGSALQQELARAGIRVAAFQPRLKKELRALKVLTYFESGRVRLPATHRHLNAWLQEHLEFPAGEHDDLVDTTIMALESLNSLQISHHRWRIGR